MNTAPSEGANPSSTLGLPARYFSVARWYSDERGASMMRAMKRLSKTKRFLLGHPYCCFCGGVEPSTTIDHVPPKACFPEGYWPEEFEFPACEKCNGESRRDDQLFGFYSQLLDFNESNRTPADVKKITKLRDSIAHNFPDALPDPSTARPIYRVGSIIASNPLAIAVRTPKVFREPIETLERKLTHALYYRETGRAVSKTHLFLSEFYQPQGGSDVLTRYLVGLLPNQTIGGRSNVKTYGERFGYKSGWKEKDDFFMYIAQFGRGLIVWGIVLGSETKISESANYLRAKPWRQGGCREKVLVKPGGKDPTDSPNPTA